MHSGLARVIRSLRSGRDLAADDECEFRFLAVSVSSAAVVTKPNMSSCRMC